MSLITTPQVRSLLFSAGWSLMLINPLSRNAGAQRLKDFTLAHLHMLRDCREQLLHWHFRPVQFDVKSGLANTAGDAEYIGHGFPMQGKDLFEENSIMR